MATAIADRPWWGFTSAGGLHRNPNVCWLVFSQLRAGHERGARPVDPVDNDRVRDAPAVDRGDGLLPSYGSTGYGSRCARPGRPVVP